MLSALDQKRRCSTVLVKIGRGAYTANTTSLQNCLLFGLKIMEKCFGLSAILCLNSPKHTICRGERRTKGEPNKVVNIRTSL